ncbi:MAG: ABC transporter permease [Anaerolineae bacterium]|nr:ABC transporter permease [Anaerolineae bacterium]
MTSLISFFRKIYDYRYLIIQMTKREIAYRYRGSALGFAWSVLNPLLMLAVYTFVFSVVFQSRWNTGNENESKVDFALTLFAGLIVFNIFSDIINRAPTLILGNVNYVKKVIFPLEILPLVSIGGVLFHSLVSLLVLLATQILFKGYTPLTFIYLPLILLPLLLAGLGISWFLSAITVYIRDVVQITGLLTTVLLFLSAVFFPISALPAQYQRILMLNPLAIIVDTSRNILIFGQPPNWPLLGVMLLIGLLMAAGGYWFFNKTRKGFADVL